MKKILLIILSILLLLSLTSCVVKGEDGKTPYIQDGYWYIDGVNTGVKAEGIDGGTEDNQGLVFYPQDDGTYVVGGGNAKYMKKIVVPEKYRGGDVVALEENAFKDFSRLETIVIPNSVKEMRKGIFAGCTSLTTISMPCSEYTYSFQWLCLDASITSISSDEECFLPPVSTINITGGTSIRGSMFSIFGQAESTFKSTLKTLTIADSITSIGNSAFASCPEEIFEIENGIKYIGKWAVGCTDKNFTLRSDTIGIATMALIPENYDFDASITQFTVPASIKYLSFCALGISPNITEYLVESGNSNYCAVDGAVYTKDMTTLVQYPCGKKQDVFSFPQGAKNIFAGAFAACQIKKIILPNGITEIPVGAFEGSTLEEIVIPNSVTKIGESAFSNSSIETITLPEGITEIPIMAFSYSKISSITLPSTLTKIGLSAFSGTNISTIEIPSGVAEIGENAFAHSKLSSIKLPNGITEIADSTFYDCDMLVSIDIPDSVTKIGERAFGQCDSLVLVKLSDRLKRIESNAFDFAPLVSVTLPKTLTYIGDDAFSGCNIIEVINNSSLYIYAGSNDHGGVAREALEVHSGESKIVKVDDYLFYTKGTANYLVAYVGSDAHLHLPENYNGQDYEIFRGVFRNRNEFNGKPIYSVIIPDCVTKIGDLVFYGCHELKEIVIGSKVTSFGNQAFDSCSGLEKVYYKGTESSWNKITQTSWGLPNYIKEAPRYYYSETTPTDDGNYWRYVNGVPTIWG